ELDPLALGQGTETVTPNGREVHEHVLSPVEVDEPVAFGLVEPLHRAPETAFVRHRALGPGTRRRPRAPAMLAAPTSRPSIGTMATIAVLAVDGTSLRRLERTRRARAAVRAPRREHLARGAGRPRSGGLPSGPAALACLTAALAARGRMRQAVRAVELLLPDREDEILPA